MSEAAAASAPAQSSAPQQAQQSNAPKPHNTATIPGTQPPKQGAAKATQPPERGEESATKPEPRKHRLNIEGEERDFDDAELAREIAKIQKHYAADKRFQEAAKLRKEAEEREARLKDKPWDVLKEKGHDPRALAEQYLWEMAQQQMMSPEQRAIAERDAKLREYETREKQRAETEQNAKLEQEAAHFRQQYEQTFVKALEHVGVTLDGTDPLAPWALQQMAQLESLNAEHGYEAPPELLAQELNDQLTRGASLLLGKLEGEPLLAQLEKLSPDLVKKVNAATIARMEAGRRQPQRQVNGTFAPKHEQKPEEKEPKQPAPTGPQYWTSMRLGFKK